MLVLDLPAGGRVDGLKQRRELRSRGGRDAEGGEGAAEGGGGERGWGGAGGGEEGEGFADLGFGLGGDVVFFGELGARGFLGFGGGRCGGAAFGGLGWVSRLGFVARVGRNFTIASIRPEV